jgi:hypothetical protein
MPRTVPTGSLGPSPAGWPSHRRLYASGADRAHPHCSSPLARCWMVDAPPPLPHSGRNEPWIGWQLLTVPLSVSAVSDDHRDQCRWVGQG